MPRRNHPRHPRRDWTPPSEKPNGKKRPRRMRRGPDRDRLYEEARRRLDEAA